MRDWAHGFRYLLIARGVRENLSVWSGEVAIHIAACIFKLFDHKNGYFATSPVHSSIRNGNISLGGLRHPNWQRFRWAAFENVLHIAGDVRQNAGLGTGEVQGSIPPYIVCIVRHLGPVKPR